MFLFLRGKFEARTSHEVKNRQWNSSALRPSQLWRPCLRHRFDTFKPLQYYKGQSYYKWHIIRDGIQILQLLFNSCSLAILQDSHMKCEERIGQLSVMPGKKSKVMNVLKSFDTWWTLFLRYGHHSTLLITLFSTVDARLFSYILLVHNIPTFIKAGNTCRCMKLIPQYGCHYFILSTKDAWSLIYSK